jgi:hypothetical protein
MKDNDSAFPVLEETRVNSDGSPCTDYVLTSPGMTLPQYAAIKLKVPRSGDPDIDAMIRESRRMDFAQASMMASIAAKLAADNLAKASFMDADAMLAEWEKEKNNV